MWDDTLNLLEEELDAQKDRENLAENKFNELVARMFEIGATNEETAIRWIVQSAEISIDDLKHYGSDYICYELGLPYTMSSKFEPVIKELLNA